MSVPSLLSPSSGPCGSGRRGWCRLGCGSLLLLGLLIAGCNHTVPPAKDKKTEVVVTTPISDLVIDYQDFTGRLDAFRTVDVRARVTGYIDDALFKEGDRVTKGQTLFLIDPRSYQALVDQATADLATRKAEAIRADALYRRSMDLVRTKAATPEDVDKQKGDYEVAKATIKQSEAKLRDAQLNLDYCKVIAPISGRISRRYVDPGNLIRADDTMLTTIVADDTVYAYFDVDERSYLDLVGEKPGASSDRVKELKLPVLLRLANSDEFTTAGALDFLDNRLNGNSGTIRMRALFANPRDTLKSGLFVRVRLPIGKPYSTLLISDEAIQSDQGRKYVFVIKAITETKEDGSEEKKDVVEYRPVQLGQLIQGLREIKPAQKDKDGKITEGLEPGEWVVVSGMQKVRAGSVVRVKEEAPPKAPGFPMGKLLGLKGEKD